MGRITTFTVSLLGMFDMPTPLMIITAVQLTFALPTYLVYSQR